ncbi:MAG: DUF4156 domain-containing protein [Labilithrix sp.]|nr:DUF4156 domain-containing protein [Labilithrix sp.]MCW5810769.1 DUF4156 domain-containing protein [Labilithrix sp.]
MPTRSLLLLAAVALTACATKPISPAGARVTASEMPPPPSCTALGEVKGRAGGQVTGQFVDGDALVGAALDDVRNEAGALGADYVYVGKPQYGVYFGSVRSASFGGRAYRCSDPAVATDARARSSDRRSFATDPSSARW